MRADYPLCRQALLSLTAALFPSADKKRTPVGLQKRARTHVRMQHSDLGCHIDGWIATQATTVLVGAEMITGRAADAVAAARTAFDVAIRLIKPGKKVRGRGGCVCAAHWSLSIAPASPPIFGWSGAARENDAPSHLPFDAPCCFPPHAPKQPPKTNDTIQNNPKTTQVSDVAEKLAAAVAPFGCQLVEGVLTHDLKQFVIDGNKVVLNRPSPEQRVEDAEFEANEVYAIDIVVSTGGRPFLEQSSSADGAGGGRRAAALVSSLVFCCHSERASHRPLFVPRLPGALYATTPPPNRRRQAQGRRREGDGRLQARARRRLPAQAQGVARGARRGDQALPGAAVHAARADGCGPRFACARWEGRAAGLGGGGRKGAGAKRGAAGPALADRAARKRLPDARTPQQNANDPTPFFPKTTAAEGPASDAAKQLRLGLVECLGHGLLHAYPVLHEKPGELVAQVKGTVLLMPNGSDRVTSAPEQPVETDKKVEDEELRKLLATGLKVSKKSKKKAASAGGGGDAEAA